MKTLKKIKLNDLNDAELRDREMNALYGGRGCGCGCNYADSGGSSISDNGNANHLIGPSGGHSIGGCKSSEEPILLRELIITPS